MTRIWKNSLSFLKGRYIGRFIKWLHHIWYSLNNSWETGTFIWGFVLLFRHFRSLTTSVINNDTANTNEETVSGHTTNDTNSVANQGINNENSTSSSNRNQQQKTHKTKPLIKAKSQSNGNRPLSKVPAKKNNSPKVSAPSNAVVDQKWDDMQNNIYVKCAIKCIPLVIGR